MGWILTLNRGAASGKRYEFFNFVKFHEIFALWSHEIFKIFAGKLEKAAVF